MSISAKNQESDQKSPEANSYTAPGNFLIMEHELVRSPNLSCKAYKLLSIGLSHSGNWIFRKNQIVKCFKEGMPTVDAAMKELREEGYLHLISRKVENGNFSGYYWFWFRKPMSDEEFKKFHGNSSLSGARQNGVPVKCPSLRRTIPKNNNLKRNNNNRRRSSENSKESNEKIDLGKEFESLMPSKSLKESVQKIVEANSLTSEDIDRAIRYCKSKKEVDNFDAYLVSTLKNGWKERQGKKSANNHKIDFIKRLIENSNVKFKEKKRSVEVWIDGYASVEISFNDANFKDMSENTVNVMKECLLASKKT